MAHLNKPYLDVLEKGVPILFTALGSQYLLNNTMELLKNRAVACTEPERLLKGKPLIAIATIGHKSSESLYKPQQSQSHFHIFLHKINVEATSMGIETLIIGSFIIILFFIYKIILTTLTVEHLTPFKITFSCVSKPLRKIESIYL